MPGKFYSSPNFPQSDLGRRADSRWALPQISSYIFITTSITAVNNAKNDNGWSIYDASGFTTS